MDDRSPDQDVSLPLALVALLFLLAVVLAVVFLVAAQVVQTP